MCYNDSCVEAQLPSAPTAMITHTLASSFRLCDDDQNDFLLKAYIVLWALIFLVLTGCVIRDIVRADTWEERKNIAIDYLQCIPMTFILPFPLAGVIIAAIIFLFGEAIKIAL